MKRILNCLSATLVGLASAGALYAGHTNFDFNVDPNNMYDQFGPLFTIVGNQNHTDPGSAFPYFWYATNGHGGPTDGFVCLTENRTNCNLVMVFPYLDYFTNADTTLTPAPLQAFKLSMWLRTGNPTNADARCADGFSINFARANDIALSNAVLANVVGGWAGGGSQAAAQAPSPGDVTVENGVKQGVSVVFDAWEGNWLPDTPIRAAGQSNDREGMAVRVDDTTLIQVAFGTTNRNSACTNLTSTPNACQAFACSNTNSIQTGPWGGVTNRLRDADLCWQPLSVELTTNKQLTVIWKGRTLISTNLPFFSATAGRIMLASRTGGNCEIVDVDDVVFDTTPSFSSFFDVLTPAPRGFTFDLQDFAASVVTNISQVLLDGTNITSLVVFSNSAPYTYCTYSQAVPFPSFSKHSVQVTWQTSRGETLNASSGFTVPVYATPPDAAILPLSAIDTNQPGFLVRAYQSYEVGGAAARWAEEQLIGLRGVNLVDTSTNDANGFSIWNAPLDFSSATPAGTSGNIPYDNSFTYLGIALNNPYNYQELNFALELCTYIYFPSNGFYTFVIAGDDSHQMRFGLNPQDRFGTIFWSADGNRTPSPTSPPQGTELVTIYVNKPGCLPTRFVMNQGGAAAAFEVYTVTGDPFNPYAALNDPSNPYSLMCYRASSVRGPYVKYANPVWDGQNVMFYQPIVMQLGDGTGNMTVNPNTIVLTSATSTNLALQVTNQLSISKAGDTTTLTLLKGTYPQWTNWPVANQITNYLYFQDNAGSNYVYTWTFNVLSLSTLLPANVVAIPASAGVAASQVDTSKPGFRIKSYQTPKEPINNSSWSEGVLEGLQGPNVADQSQATGGIFVWTNVIDFHYAGTATPSTTPGGGQWNFERFLLFNGDGNASFPMFGLGTVPNNGNPQAPTYRFQAANLVETAVLDISCWLVFPYAGTYTMQVNSDDGFAAYIPQGNPFGKLGTTLFLNNNGRGVQAGIAGGDTGGTGNPVFSFNIPQAGAYPFRLLYENGTTGAGLEVAIYQFLPNGSVGRVPIMDPTQPYSIKAYQTLAGANDSIAPYVKYVNPVRAALDVVPWQPVVADLADGPGSKTVNTNSIQLLADNVVQSIVVSQPLPGVSHVVQQMSNPWVTNSTHTVLLTYRATDGTAYTNTWTFTVMPGGTGLTAGVYPYGVATLLASNSVPTNLVDHSQPGLRVKLYETVAAAPPNIAFAEESFAGLHGDNIASNTPTGYYTWNNPVDFADNLAVNAAKGEYRYNYSWSNYLGLVINGTGGSENYDEAIFAGWFEFPKAGTYAFAINADDRFKLTSPFGKNPFGEPGSVLYAVDGSGGDSGAAYPPTGGSHTHVVFNVPAPGAYPIRLLWYNGTGSISLEWSLYEYLNDGSIARLLVGDSASPGSVKVYQALLAGDSPYVGFVQPALPNTPGQNVVNNWMSQTNASLGNLQNAITDVNILLNDGVTTTVRTDTIQLLFNGVPQPITLTYSNGVTTIVRPAAALPPWPSGGFGPLVLSYQDSGGAAHNDTVEYLETPFWGTLTNALTRSVDTNKPGFKMRAYQLNPQPNGATTIIPNRIHVAEQILAGLWGTNATIQAAYTNGGYINLLGTGPTAGVINFNLLGAATIGDFLSTGGFPDQVWPGIPGIVTANANTNNDFAVEILAYVEFPTNGTYTLGVASDDGFRLIRDWTPPASIGALTVNSPAGLAGRKPTVINGSSGGNTPYISLPLTNAITGNLVLAQGTGYGSTTNGEGCIISNPGQLAGNIAVMYRSAYCGYAQQVANAQAAGALGVVFIQNRLAAEGPFPQEPAVTPYAAIPCVEIEQADGKAIVTALNGGTNVNATLTPMEYTVNPPPANPVLGQDDQGKGATDVQFPVVVQQPGVYPLRLTYWQGSGGGNCEFFSVTGANRVLINDRTATTGPGPNGSGLRAWYALVQPTLSQTFNGSSVTLTFTGILQQSTDLVNWQDVPGNPASPLTLPANQAKQFFRSRLGQ